MKVWSRVASSRVVGSDNPRNTTRPTTVYTVGEPETRASDVELIHRVQSGDTEAFDELMKRYVASVYKVTYSLTRNHADADDLSQETFIRAYRAIGRFDEHYQFYTWVRRIAVNLCFNHLKRGKKFRFVPLPIADGDDESADIADPQPQSADSGLRRDLEQALVKLPPDQRAVFVLRVNEEMSYDEISHALGIPVGTVMSRLNRAREKLRELLREYMPAT
jgi:RNA polymerase sigma-70 factor (ECF subfamily)